MGVTLVNAEELSQQEQEQQARDAAAAAEQARKDASEENPGGEKTEKEIAEEARLAAEATQNREVELSDDVVLSYINNKRGANFSSMDEAFTQQQAREVELDEPVAAFNKFHQETGGSIDDYFKINRDRTNDDDDTVLREFIKEQNPSFTSDDISFSLKTTYGYDEDAEDVEIRSKQLNKKQEISKARSYFDKKREEYKGSLESRKPSMTAEDQANIDAWKSSQEQAAARQEAIEQQRARFQNDTNQVFSDNFEGFEFNLGEDKKVTYKIEDVSKVKDLQANTQNFVNKHLDENGALIDPAAYHKAMFAANDPDGLYKQAYESGFADAVESNAKESKNIRMTRNANQSISKDNEVKVTAVNQGGSKVRIPLPKEKQ